MSEHACRTIIVDDEPVARRRVRRLLGRHQDFEIVDECSGGQSAVESIRELTPDLVFLDIQMPDLDGFGVIQTIGVDRMPSVVFVTAFDQHAVRAFDLHALDYLLKPYSESRFDEALEQARNRLHSNGEPTQVDEPLRALLATMLERSPSLAAPSYHDRVAVKSNGSTRIVPIADVDWFETDGNYVRVHVAGRSYLIRNTANRLEQTLDPRHFARIHRRYLVNLDRVAEIEPWFGGDAVVHLRDGGKLRLSRNYREAFHARMLGDHSASAPSESDE